MSLGRILPVLAGLLLGAIPSQGFDFYVNPDIGDDRRSVQAAQDSTLAFRTITHALRIAHLIPNNRPHVIHIARANYSPSTGETFPLEINQTGIYVDAAAGVVFNAERNSKFFDIKAPTSDFTIQNIVFFNGQAEQGGVVSCNTCTLRVTNNRFIDNNASQSGHVVHMEGGRLTFANNLLDNNGINSDSDTGAVIDIANANSDTLQRDVVRNNTFYRNAHTNIRAGGSRVDISNNIFLAPDGPAITDVSPTADPLVRHNMFWETDLLYISDSSDSIKVSRTVRDTVTLADRGIILPEFVTNIPDTAAQADVQYTYFIEVEGDRAQYEFNRLSIPSGAQPGDANDGFINWTPAQADTGSSHEIRYRIKAPDGIERTLQYTLRVFSATSFPDTATIGVQDTLFFVPDTTGALSSINTLQPTFSAAASAGGNLYINPAFLDTMFNRFELDIGSPAIDAGTPEIARNDQSGTTNDPRNDMGNFGGPRHADTPAADTTFKQLRLLNLPDSIAVEGEVYSYIPVLDSTESASVFLVDLIKPYSAPSMIPFGGSNGESFGKDPPILWTPTIADTGKHLIGIKVYAGSNQQGDHFFELRVKPNNEAPILAALADSIAFEDSLYSVQLVANDPNNDEFTYQLLIGPPGSSLTPTGLLQWTPSQNDIGTAAFSLRLSDARGASSDTGLQLLVLNTNDPPLFTSLPPTQATEDQPYRYILAVSDPDPVDTLSLRLVTAPRGMSVEGDSAVVWTPLQAAIGNHEINISLEDRAGATALQTFIITVNAVDDPPLITSLPDTLAFEDAAYIYSVVATDEEDTRLSYRLSTAPAAMEIDSTGTISWTPAASDTGRQAIVVEISDSAAQTAVQSYTLNVQSVNDPPALFGRSPADSLVFPTPNRAVSFSVTFSDEEGAPLSLSWEINGALRSDATNASFTYSPSTDKIDTVRATASDGQSSTPTAWIVDGRAIARINLDTAGIDFGTVALGDTTSRTLILKNSGNSPLEISNLSIGDLDLSARFAAATIADGDSTTLDISYIPTLRGALASFIRFNTNASDIPQISLALTGQAVAPTGLSLDLDTRPGDQGALEATLGLDSSVVLEIYAVQASALTNYELTLALDPRLVFTGASAQGGLLDAAGNTVILESQTEDNILTIGATTTQTAVPANGDGLLARIDLTGTAAFDSETLAALTLTRAILHNGDGGPPDTLNLSLSAQVQGRPALAEDLDGDGKVDFSDFFLFSDRFGSDDPGADFNGDGIVDLDDFFLFADRFGSSSDSLDAVGKTSPLPGLAVSTVSMTDTISLQLVWDGDSALRGYALELAYDPAVLTYKGFGSSSQALRLEPADRPGHLRLAAALPASQPDYGAELGAIVFARDNNSASTALNWVAAWGYSQGNTIQLQPPAPVQVQAMPQVYSLGTAYPNPFNPETTIPFSVPQTGVLRLVIFDLLGQSVRVLLDGHVDAGRHLGHWDGRDEAGRQVAAGVYLLEMRAADYRQVGKLLLLK